MKRLEWLLLWLAMFSLPLLLVALAFGQSRMAHITFKAPLTRVDGKKLVGPVTFRLYAGNAGPGKSVVAQGFKSGDAIEVTGGLCFEVAAVDENGIEGLHTKEKCLPAQARAPTEFSVTEATEVSPQ